MTFGAVCYAFSGFFGIFPFFWQKKIYIHQEN